MVNRLLQLFRSRRSIRFFEKNPIPDDHVKMILEAARWAPSAANAQPWEFIVISDPRVKHSLQNTMSRVASTVRVEYPQFPWHATARDPKLISQAPVIVAVCADFNRKELRKYDVMPLKFKQEIVLSSIAAAIQNAMLMAAALGIGSVWLSPLFTEEIERLFRIPETLQLVALLPFGYPARRNLAGPRRRRLNTMVHYNRFNCTPEP